MLLKARESGNNVTPYRPSHSMVTATLRVLPDILFMLDSGDIMDLTLLEQAAASKNDYNATLL